VIKPTSDGARDDVIVKQTRLYINEIDERQEGCVPELNARAL
jgi:hypothetical protein